MSIHIKSFLKACDNLGLNTEKVGKSGLFYQIKIDQEPLHFIANRIPLNDSVVAEIMEDKGYTYDLLSGVINMPRTEVFLDPQAKEMFQPYVLHKSLEEIAQAIEASFTYPVIIKRSSGSQGVNVFKCSHAGEAIEALSAVFNQQSPEYDHVALVQDNIEIDKEYRVTLLNKQVELAYHKDNSQADFGGNLSPLHWSGAKAHLVTDQDMLAKFASFLQPIYQRLDLKYAGADIAVDASGKLWLLELNSQPAYDHLVASSGEKPLINLYEKILSFLAQS